LSFFISALTSTSLGTCTTKPSAISLQLDPFARRMVVGPVVSSFVRGFFSRVFKFHLVFSFITAKIRILWSTIRDRQLQASLIANCPSDSRYNPGLLQRLVCASDVNRLLR
jgi:hypothetical protein